jgi:hypothetical protein
MPSQHRRNTQKVFVHEIGRGYRCSRFAAVICMLAENAAERLQPAMG